MSLETYLGVVGPKYVIVSKDTHTSEPVASQLAPEPRSFVYNGVEHVAINVEPLAVPELAAYIEQQAGVEFEFVQGSGNASLLTHAQVLDLLSGIEEGYSNE